jgi:putative NADPH-quinone reductase
VRALVVHAHPSARSFSRALCDATERGLQRAGHAVDVVHLDDEGFGAAMTSEERLAYHSSDPIRDPTVARHAELVRRAEALVFVYPTWWAAQPAILKAWLERVLVPGVAFHLDPRTHRVRRDLRNLRRLAGVTTYGSDRAYVRILSDPGRRTITRTLRTLCHPLCRSTWLGLYGMDTATDAQRRAFLERVEQRMARW